MSAPLARVPCTIVTGFLGSGKTTLIRHVLGNANGRRLAVIVNEFGDVGIDGEILKGCGDAACPEENIVELANGCLCCTVADEFVPALDQILARRPQVEHIVIETSGLALPKPLVQAFHWPAIKSRVTVDGVVAVVDGAALADGQVSADLAALIAQRAADTALDHDDPIEEVFEDQIACADLVVLNKRDLLDAAGMDRAMAAIVGALPRAVRIVTVADGKVDPAALLGLGVGTEDDIENRKTHHDDELDHDHDDFDSFVVPMSEIGDPAAIARRIAARRRGPQRVAHEGFRGGGRKEHAAPGAGGGAARQPLLRPALGGVGAAAGKSGGDRSQGPRSRRGRQGAAGVAMHLLQTGSVGLDDMVEPVDLGQTPGEIVVLSFADSDLAGLAAAYAAEKDRLPSLRLAHLRELRHPMSIDLWIDTVGRHAKVIVVRLLGGLDWWRYGVEALSEMARERTIALAVLPGEDRTDPRLDQASTLAPDELAGLLAFFREGGRDNLRALLRRLAGHAGRELDAPHPQAVPRQAGYLPGKGAVSLDELAASLAAGAPVVPIIFYRAALLAADTAPIDALCEALAARGLAPAPLVVPSLKDEQAGDVCSRRASSVCPGGHRHHHGVRRRRRGRDFAARLRRRAGAASGDRHHATRRVANEPARSRAGRPRHACGAARARRPRAGGRDRLQGCVAQGSDDLAFAAHVSRPEPDRVEMVADRIAALVRLRQTPRSERRIAVLMPDYPAAGGRAGYAVGLDVPASVLALLSDLGAAGYGVGDQPEGPHSTARSP